MGYERSWVALSSAQTSTYTSNPFLVADAATLSVSVITAAAVSSTVTIQGSNDDGLSASIANWSTVTGVTAPGLYTIDPGARWLRVQRGSLDSATSVKFQTWCS